MGSLFDYLNSNDTLNNDGSNLKAFKESYDDTNNNDKKGISESDVDELTKKIEDKINYKFTSSEGLDLSFKHKNILDLEAELDNIREMQKEAMGNVKKKLDIMAAGLAAKIESTKFITQKINKFRWKKNTAYLVFHRGKTLLGTLISLATFSPFSHCDIVIEGKAYTAYADQGVCCTGIPDTSEIVIYELLPEFKPKNILKFYEKTKGTRYGFTDAVRGQINLLDKNKDAKELDSFFCSQWVTAALDYASGGKKKYNGKHIKSIGYNFFSPINVFRWVMNATDILLSKKSLTMNNEITAGYSKRVTLPSGASFLMYDKLKDVYGFGEAGEDDIPSGELGEEGPVEDTGDDMNFNDEGGGSDDDYNFDDGENMDGEEDGNTVKDPLQGIEDSEKSLVGDLRKNMSSFYKARENDLEKILSSNIGTSEYGKEVNDLIENYKTTLSLYETYLRNEYYKESTTNKIMSFVKYKSIFNRLNETLNQYFNLLGVQEE